MFVPISMPYPKAAQWRLVGGLGLALVELPVGRDGTRVQASRLRVKRPASPSMSRRADPGGDTSSCSPSACAWVASDDQQDEVSVSSDFRSSGDVSG